MSIEPANPAVAPNVIRRFEAVGGVQSSNIDFNRPGAVTGPKRDLRSTIPTELSLPVRG